MKEIGASLLVKTVAGLAAGSLTETPQAANPDLLKHAPKIHTDTCRINWSLTAEEIYNQVRGLSPYPGAFTILNEKMLKVFRCEKEIVFPKSTEGDYETDGKTWLKIACSNGYIHLLDIQLEGKKKMEITEFLRGYRFA